MFKCLNCGHLFEDGEQAVWEESRGEFWGQPAYQRESGCPLCKGSYANASRCSICDEWYSQEELNNGVCTQCLDSHKNNAEICFSIGNTQKENIKINLFLCETFNEEEMERILLAAAIKKQKKGDNVCQKFADYDLSWFAEKLSEVKNGRKF